MLLTHLTWDQSPRIHKEFDYSKMFWSGKRFVWTGTIGIGNVYPSQI